MEILHGLAPNFSGVGEVRALVQAWADLLPRPGAGNDLILRSLFKDSVNYRL